MTILIRGVRGESVRQLQHRLGLRGARGIYDRETERAVIRYQQAHRLRPSGIADADTFASLGLYEMILLRVGSKGEIVRRLQQALGLETSGRFDRATEAAVRAYQAAHGLKVDGLAGPETLGHLRLLDRGRFPVAGLRAPTGSHVWQRIEGAAGQATARMRALFGMRRHA